MALSFQIAQGSNCDKLEYINCSEYCTAVTYDLDYCLARLKATTTINAATGAYMFEGEYEGSGTVSTHAWSFTNAASVIVTSSSALIVVGLDLSATNTITYTVTDSNGLTSVLTMKVKVASTGAITWLAAPSVEMTAQANATGPANNIYFVENSTLTSTAIDTATDTLVFGDATSASTLPQLKDYGTSNVTRSGSYTYNEDTNDTSVNVTFQIKVTGTSASCEDELTEDGITEVLLTITNPDGDSDTLDITDYFFDSPFYLDAETFGEDGSDEFDNIDFETPGIYQFRTTVTKVDGSTYVFSECIKVVVICSIRCAYDSLLYDLTQEDCSDCESTHMDQAIEMYMYIKALENAIACADTSQINVLIDLLETLADSVDCDC